MTTELALARISYHLREGQTKHTAVTDRGEAIRLIDGYFKKAQMEHNGGPPETVNARFIHRLFQVAGLIVRTAVDLDITDDAPKLE